MFEMAIGRTACICQNVRFAISHDLRICLQPRFPALGNVNACLSTIRAENPHSYRRACMGSARIAARAGIRHARSNVMKIAVHSAGKSAGPVRTSVRNND
jgi:hypothetical protein